MTATKKSISAMMHKIRGVLSERDNTYKLEGEVELDEGFYSISLSFGIDEFSGVKETLKRGKGSQKKAKVLVMASFKKVHISEFKFTKYLEV
jgi:hypothetical protein